MTEVNTEKKLKKVAIRLVGGETRNIFDASDVRYGTDTIHVISAREEMVVAIYPIRNILELVITGND